MGEPLHNYAPVVAAIRLMTNAAVFGLGRRHVTLSTVGVIPRVLQLADDLPVCFGSSMRVSLCGVCVYVVCVCVCMLSWGAVCSCCSITLPCTHPVCAVVPGRGISSLTALAALEHSAAVSSASCVTAGNAAPA